MWKSGGRNLMFAAMMSIGGTPVAAAETGFVPELGRVEVSATEVAPGKSFQMTCYWRNAGSEAALTDMMVAVHLRDGDTGFFNPDGGSWWASYSADYKGPRTAGFPFQADYFPALPTTRWDPGMSVVEGPMTVTVPAEAPDATYDVLIAIYDRGGRITFSPANGALRSRIENYTSYKVGTLRVSRSAGELTPASWNLAPYPLGRVMNPQPKPVSDIKALRPADADPSWAGEIVTVGDKRLGIGLDKTRNYALAAVYAGGTTFESSGKFPALVVYNESGERLQLLPDDPRWKVSAKKVRRGLEVSYKMHGFDALVAYDISRDGIDVTVTPTKEEKYKALLLSGGGALVNVPADKTGAVSSSYVIVPTAGGSIVRFPSTTQQVTATAWQSLYYIASFFGIGYRDQGLIVRCPQYGATWSYGSAEVGGKFSLYGEFAEAFRPSAQHFDMPRPEHHISLQLVPVGDVNGDGECNWVDIGVAYRQKFVRLNRKKDTHLRDSVFGKIQVSAPYTGVRNYSDLIQQIRSINFAPQVWWLVGAHVPADREFCDPSYADSPDPTHNGLGGYDYFAFKRDAEKAGARIGLHELYQDVSHDSPDFDKVPLKLDLYGKPKRTWGGTSNGVSWQMYAKALNAMLEDGSLFRAIDRHFKNWGLRSGNTWHWDCLSAMCGQQDYSPAHPATNGTDFRDGIEMVRYIKGKGIHFTSEGLQEGMAEYVDMAWRSDPNPFKPAQFENSDSIPLTPVLFQGMTYYASGWYPAVALLYGGKSASEATTLDRDKLIASYFGLDVFWQKVADRTVKNMVKTEKGYRVEYTEGGTLTVDLANITPAASFILAIDGQRYTAENPPASPWGVSAKLVGGKYVLE